MIFHAKKRNGFLMVDKAALNDNRISLKAKGLLCYLLSKPPDWRPQIDDICKHCADKETAVRSALQELAEFGYAKLVRIKAEGGRWEGSFWTIYECPDGAGIEVSRIPENPNLKVPRMRKRNNNYSSLRDDVPAAPVEGLVMPARDKLVEENNGLIERLLVGHIEDSFVEQWRARATHSPWLTMDALAKLANLVAAEKAGYERIRNRGGMANWEYLNHGKAKNARKRRNSATRHAGRVACN